jgi:hypothetical protein
VQQIALLRAAEPIVICNAINALPVHIYISSQLSASTFTRFNQRILTRSDLTDCKLVPIPRSFSPLNHGPSPNMQMGSAQRRVKLHDS